MPRLTVCQSRDVTLAEGDRLHLKANRKLASGGRVTNGELVTVKSVRADGGIELSDGRVLDSSFREFLPGYTVTPYGSQGKTVDYRITRHIVEGIPRAPGAFELSIPLRHIQRFHFVRI